MMTMMMLMRQLGGEGRQRPLTACVGLAKENRMIPRDFYRTSKESLMISIIIITIIIIMTTTIMIIIIGFL